MNKGLRGIDTLGSYPTIYFDGDNFCDLLFAFMHTKSFLKRVFSKRTEFANLLIAFVRRDVNELWQSIFP